MQSELIEGQNYKIGLHGKIFVMRNDDWALTKNVKTSDVMLARENRLAREKKESEKQQRMAAAQKRYRETQAAKAKKSNTDPSRKQVARNKKLAERKHANNH